MFKIVGHESRINVHTGYSNDIFIVHDSPKENITNIFKLSPMNDEQFISLDDFYSLYPMHEEVNEESLREFVILPHPYVEYRVTVKEISYTFIFDENKRLKGYLRWSSLSIH